MNSNLISKNISGYFDDLINKPVITPPLKQSTIITFYKNYVEHNLLLIIIIIFIIIFLLFKYFTKDCDLYDDDAIEKKKRKKIKKEIRKEQENKFLEKINKERKLLEKEKSEILSIIDELSEINYKKNIIENIKEEKNEDKPKEPNNKINNFIYNKISYEPYTNNQNYSDDYYDIKENKSELIDGIYFETPYN